MLSKIQKEHINMKAIRKIIAALVALSACMSYTFALADNVNTNYSDSAYQTVSTVADSGKCGDNLKWVLDTNGTITICCSELFCSATTFISYHLSPCLSRSFLMIFIMYRSDRSPSVTST